GTGLGGRVHDGTGSHADGRGPVGGGVGAHTQGSGQVQGAGAFLGGQVDVTAGGGKAVVVTQDGRTHDLHREVQVDDHAPDQEELLDVLGTEHRQVGADEVEEFGHHGEDAGEEIGRAHV